MALNLTAIPTSTLAGKALRLPLRLIPPATVLPVLQGPLRGLKWITGSANHGAWLGTYERGQQFALANLLRPGTRFWDLGAHAGLYTLLAARLCGPENVLAVEPLPSNVAHLRRHLSLNHMTQVTVLEAAIARQSGELGFADAPDASMGRLTHLPGTRRVAAYSLDDLLATGIFPPDVIKCDIEGAEAEAFEGALHTLRTYRPVIFLSIHEEECPCIGLLTSLGYRVTATDGQPLDVTSEIVALP